MFQIKTPDNKHHLTLMNLHAILAISSVATRVHETQEHIPGGRTVTHTTPQLLEVTIAFFGGGSITTTMTPDGLTALQLALGEIEEDRQKRQELRISGVPVVPL